MLDPLCNDIRNLQGQLCSRERPLVQIHSPCDWGEETCTCTLANKSSSVSVSQFKAVAVVIFLESNISFLTHIYC